MLIHFVSCRISPDNGLDGGADIFRTAARSLSPARVHASLGIIILRHSGTQYIYIGTLGKSVYTGFQIFTRLPILTSLWKPVRAYLSQH
jgi:hypothetical protein